MPATATRTTEGDIWLRVIQPQKGNFPKNVARGILGIHFDDEDTARMLELAEKNNEGKLSRQEREELAQYVLVGDVLSLLHLKARKSLNK